MNLFLLGKGNEEVLKNYVEEEKARFFVPNLFKKITFQDNLEEYNSIIKKHRFNYLSKWLKKKRGFEEPPINIDLSHWMAKTVSEYLQPVKKIEELNDENIISSSQLITTYEVLFNNLAREYEKHIKENFISFTEIKPLFSNYFFGNNLYKEINFCIFSLLEDKIQEYFSEFDFNNKERVYSKMNVRCENKTLKNNKNALRDKNKEYGSEVESKQGFNEKQGCMLKNNGSEEVFKKIKNVYEGFPLLKKRKEEGNAINETHLIHYAKKINSRFEDDGLNSEFLEFVSSSYGKKLLNYEGKITDGFLRCVRTNLHLIKDLYGK